LPFAAPGQVLYDGIILSSPPAGTGGPNRPEGSSQMPHSVKPEATPAAADLSGRTLDDFHVLRRLGAGGMGQVYLAEQVSLKRRVALKILKSDLAADPKALQRFKREAESVARVTHANIVQVYQVGAADGLHYMALEYVEGRNLRDYLARKGPPSVALALSIMRQVAAALQRAGELGIVHRDIKPENILLTRKGEVKVADFGLSLAVAAGQPALSLTQTGVSMGTPLYMSPEQVEGKPLDPRTDIYSFGVSCYHMLAGQPPFGGQNAFEVALQHVRGEPVPLASLRPDLPADLCAVVHKMMAKRPEDRYQACRELLADLARLREGLQDGGAGVGVTGPLAISAPLPLVTQELLTPGTSGKVTGQVPGASTAAAAVRPRRQLPWLVAASVLLAAACGAGLGWLRLHAGTKLASGASPGTEVADPRPLPSEADRENFLKTGVQQFLKPAGATPQEKKHQLRMGLDHAVELTVFYLDRWRLAEAEELFGKLTAAGEKVPEFRQLGRVGHAIVLALQDRAVESNKLFLEIVGEREKLQQAAWLRQNPKMQIWIARALDHNTANLAPVSLPKELRPLQAPPSFPAPRRGPDKPTGSK
jgi:serine/threonine-protein kinase